MQDLARRASVVLFVVLSIFLIMFGALYASVRDFLPFHAAAMPSSSLESARSLYLALMKLIGGSSAALGLLGCYVALGPVRRGHSMAAITLAGAFAGAFAMAAFVAETLANATQAPTSWHIMGVLLAITATALGAHFASLKARAQ